MALRSKYPASLRGPDAVRRRQLLLLFVGFLAITPQSTVPESSQISLLSHGSLRRLHYLRTFAWRYVHDRASFQYFAQL